MEERHVGTNGARVFLQPIAAPSILGLFAFATATLAVGANLAGWYGGMNRTGLVFVAPLVAVAGLAQLLAGMWCYRARDGLGTAVHTLWGSFWIAFGLLLVFSSAGTIPAIPATGTFVPLGYWFLPVSIVTLIGSVAALRVNVATSAFLLLLAAAAAIEVPGFFLGRDWLIQIGGYAFLLSALAATYTATGLLTHSLFGREIPPLGSLAKRPSLAIGVGEPGVMVGQ
ncbi:MAG: GPR1/FUN34/YaaH family transporter [Dehalococcoidia bacterium]|jgi:succinate-acetate transporter protein